MSAVRRVHSLLACAALTIFSVAVANAADMPMKAPPLVAPAFSWSGFYAGLHGGYGWDPAHGTFSPGAYGTALSPTLVITSGGGPFDLRDHPSGWFGGLQFGYNWQTGTMVYGWEADFSGGDLRDEDVHSFLVTATSGGDNATFAGQVRLKQRVDYFGTARGRLGWTFNSLLLYATGGFAWGHVKTDFDVFNVTALGPSTPAALLAGASASASRIQVGFAAGAGLEWALASAWSVKAEYLFIDLPTGTTLVIPGGHASTDFWMHTVRIGLNYRFAPGP
jgi:outer membrane immunogenic protein